MKSKGEISGSTAITLVKDAICGSYYYTSEIKTNYESLRRIVKDRKNHRLKYWDMFIHYIEQFPLYNEFIDS